jgi:hypothetical protein
VSGPWEDYAQTGGPWQDYAAQQPTTSALSPESAAAANYQYSPLNNTGNAAHPVTGELTNFAQNAWTNLGNFFPTVGLRARQAYNAATGGPSLDAEVAEKRRLDAPLMATVGGKVGAAAPYAALAMLPGANTYLGAAAYGGLAGAAQPTMSTDYGGNAGATAINTVGSAAGSAVGLKVGNVLGNWISGRATQPFMGWGPGTANRVAAEAVGSNAPALNQSALGRVADRFESIFGAAHSPAVTNPLGGSTAQAVTDAAKGLNTSSLGAFQGNASVQDLMNLMRNGTATSAQLGEISSSLGAEARQQMTSQMGDRAAGRAMFQLKEHVDDIIGASIQDPALASAYQAARGQYRNYSNITANPTILNSVTGDVNMTKLGQRLQRVDKPGYLRGGNTSDLYNAARWGQATGEGKGAPEFDLTKNLALPWFKYQALNNPASRALGGATSRLGAPLAPIIPQGLEGLAIGATPVGLPYLEQ